MEHGILQVKLHLGTNKTLEYWASSVVINCVAGTLNLVGVELVTTPKSQIGPSQFHTNRHGYTTRMQTDFSVICYDYVIRLLNIENRYFLRIWLWYYCYHISTIHYMKFENNSCNILDEKDIWVAVLPRVELLTKVMPDFWRAVYHFVTTRWLSLYNEMMSHHNEKIMFLS